jgi:mannose-6-phosphate isomerase-like protein (cupin superfamily)
MKTDRRSLLYSLGIVSIAPLLAWQKPGAGAVVSVKPDETRFAYANPQQGKIWPCKLTSEDSASTLSIFELHTLPRSGPFRHVHHREDEWYYVISGNFVFEAGDNKYHLQQGGSIWLPKGIPHLWANTGNSDGTLILACQPGGFERFFDELGRVPAGQMTAATMAEVMAKYGMTLVGPPLFGSLYQKH